MEDIILYFSCKYFGEWERIYNALEKQEDIDFEEIKRLKNKYKGMYTTVLSNDYPLELKHIDRPPFALFFKGNKDLLNKKNKMWYFGSYYNSLYDKTILKHKDDFLKNELVIVTGYTNDFERKFIDNAKPKNWIIIKDSGIDSYINMSKIEEDFLSKTNLIISEYPDKVIPSPYTWKISNKIKSGISSGMFLINTLKEKMTFKLIADTIDEKKEIFCFDKNIDNKSHNQILISKGAYAINDIKEIKKHG
ncbi:MAG: DNA-processing protein DprA [Mycoplasmataceae bacterium]|nr:DNA-processing protein DprA [Mycoplasmataceae bacterium]